jgi:hypothetical protein
VQAKNPDGLGLEIQFHRGFRPIENRFEQQEHDLPLCIGNASVTVV